MITTIFSGHSLNWQDVRAISGVMRQVKSSQPFTYISLYVEVFLRDNVTLHHEGIKLQSFYGNGLEADQKTKFDAAFEELTRQRQAFINEWNAALGFAAVSTEPQLEKAAEADSSPQPQTWQLGDLIDHPSYGRSLLIKADCWPTWVRFISEKGDQFDLSEFNSSAFRHNTGLQYTYTDQGTADRDFKKGFFTPYFEIL